MSGSLSLDGDVCMCPLGRPKPQYRPNLKITFKNIR
jgi:hypothetical protein